MSQRVQKRRRLDRVELAPGRLSLTSSFFFLLQKALFCCLVAKLLSRITQGRKEKKHRKQQINELNNDQ